MEVDDKLIGDLLKHDLRAFSFKIGAIDLRPDLDVKLATKALNLAEKLSRDFNNTVSKQKCLLICGLIWEHRNIEWEGLVPFMVRLLTRIGLSPSTIMIDQNIDNESLTYSGLGSILDETYVASYLIDSEVEVSKGNSILLSQFQKSIWMTIDEHKFLGISAPTSAGKSYVLINKIISMIQADKKKFLFVVPTLSLINQLSKDFAKNLKSRGFDDVVIHQVVPNDFFEDNLIHIFILTQERLSTGLNGKNNFLEELDLAVFDEIQNIERANLEDDERAKRLYESILTLRDEFNPHKIIISGPRISNISVLTKQLFGQKAVALSTNVPPVVNITYSFSYKNKKLILNQYNYITESQQSIELNNEYMDKKLFGKQKYGKEIVNLLLKLIEGLNEDESGSIIFSPTANYAPKIASMISSEMQQNKLNKELTELITYISDTVHPKYSLIGCLKKELAYHHGKMPMHVRNVVEIAFKELLIKNLVCTTTLIQGVNLPVKNIITRNPHLFTRRNVNNVNPTLSGYDFSNLKGRAGRLMQDFLGRTIILDEEMFVKESINPEETPEKEINTGYASRFNEHEEYILKELNNNTEVSFHTYEKDILIYIRQTIIKYGLKSSTYLNRVGIFLSELDIKKINVAMSSLKVSKEICINNRYWDPITLNRLKKLYENGSFPSIPTRPNENDFVEKIMACLIFIKNHCSLQYFKYINITEENWLYAIVITAQKWSSGDSLKEIISWKKDIKEEDVEKVLNNINSMVSYNIPIVLKPLVEIVGIENNLLAYLETGLFNPIQRKMLEFGINRELTISLFKTLTKDEIEKYNSGKLNDKSFKTILSSKLKFLSTWEQKQLKLIV
ncbi:DEAD/DEAH box helicase [Exiguobacterium sp. PHA03]|uniref:DEAD/DEAH box helicase n=1 Tax=Exiguobacterium sp. PHA03 TaxID=3064895 RepID=UPI0035C0943E